MRPDSSATSQGRRTPAELLGDRKARLQSIFMEARAEIGTAEPGVADALQRPQPRGAPP